MCVCVWYLPDVRQSSVYKIMLSNNNTLYFITHRQFLKNVYCLIVNKYISQIELKQIYMDIGVTFHFTCQPDVGLYEG